MNTEEVTQENTSSGDPDNAVQSPVLEAMAKAGILFGRKRMRTNPKMRKFVFTNRNGFEIFDLNKTLECVEKAKAFLKEVAKKDQLVLIVGTEPAAHEAALRLAEKFKFPHVLERWLGGTLTNFETLSQRLQYYITLKADKAAGKLEKYTKKERTQMDKEIERLTRLFGGLEPMDKMPSALLVIGASAHETAIAEANKTKVPVVAIANTNADPETIGYIIPANDNSRSSIDWITAQLEEGIEAGKKERTSAPKQTEDKKSE